MMKFYKVICCGMMSGFGSGQVYGVVYVVVEDFECVYCIVCASLDM